MNGGWTDFEEWSVCSKKCDTGTQTRKRFCTNPIPENGGNDCEGNSTVTQECNPHGCPVNGAWTDFGEWSPCSKKCGTGNQIRNRLCANPIPGYGGNDCSGSDTEAQNCNTHPCIISRYMIY